MNKNTFSLSKLTLALGLAVAANYSGIALAADDNAEKDIEVIEVTASTGTLIEGIDPVGSNVLAMSEEDIQALGGSTGDELLRKLPQMNDFNGFAQPTNTSSIPFNPPQIRGIGALSGMATLVLLNGHRIVPQGTGFNWVDPSMIPASLLQRVEVIPDGGSSMYGSDAVAGVINFIPKQNLDGGELSAKYGIGKDGYNSFDLSGAFGTTWDKGSLLTAFSYSKTDAVYGSGLDYIIEDLSPYGGDNNSSTKCAPGNVAIGSDNYALPSLTSGANYCSTYDEHSFFPENDRASVFAFLKHEFTDSISLDLMTFYSVRETHDYDPRDNRVQVGITSDNPYFTSVAGETEHDVAFSYEDVFGGLGRDNASEYDSWGFTPTLKVELGGSWNVQTTLNIGHSVSEYNDASINATAQAAALASTDSATALNPYDVSATDAAVLATIKDWSDDYYTEQDIQELKFLFSGDLFDISGGTVKTAFGVEARTEEFDQSISVGAANTTTPDITYIDRKSKSVFGEVYVPLIGEANAMTGIQTLELSLSARYDDYNDVGDTTNPKIGLTYQPNDDVTVRASWGTSFHAPSLADLAAPLQYELFLPFSPKRAADSPFIPDFFMPSFTLGGAKEGLIPEKAETSSLGVNWFITDSFNVDVTYWTVDYEDRLGQNASFYFSPAYYEGEVNEPFYSLKPANAQEVIDKFGDYPTSGFPDLQTMFDVMGNPYVVSDQRKDNMGAFKLKGLDFAFSYSTDIDLGEIFTNVSGTYILERDKEAVKGGGYIDTLKVDDNGVITSPLNLTATLGLSAEEFTLSGTVYHKSSAKAGEENIDSFTTLSLYASYSYSDDTVFTINMDNAFDAAPPFRAADEGVAFHSLGRTISFGVNTKF